MKLIKLLNPENVSEAEVASYTIRKAARGVIMDSEGNVALLHVTKDGYYKLPGGGLEGNEDSLIAFARECKEEIGCDIEVTQELGQIVEYRKMYLLKQTSYCYVGKVVGEKKAPSFTESELAGGFVVEWLPIDSAVEKVRNGKTSNPEGTLFIIPRDVAILEAANVADSCLKLISADRNIVIDTTKSTETLADAQDMFSYIDPILKDLENGTKEVVTPEVAVEIYEQIKDADYRTIFGSISQNTDRLVLTTSQIKSFVINHTKDYILKAEEWTCFRFLFKSGGEFFVADIRILLNGERNIRITRFTDGSIRHSKYHHRIVVPK